MKLLKRAVWRASLALMICSALSLPAEAQTIGSSMVTYLNGKQNTRVGGGESAHLAIEALQASGGEFYAPDLGADYPTTGDSVWGALVTTISYENEEWNDSRPDNACLPGDIIQYGGGAVFGTTTYPAHHTSIVKAVDTNQSRPTAVYQQNFEGDRTVTSDAMDVATLTAGWIRIYRPKARTDAANAWKFTVVNNSSSAQTYTIMVDVTTISTVAATAANTAGSYRVHRVTTEGTLPCVLADYSSIYVQNAKGDEILNPSSRRADIRQILE